MQVGHFTKKESTDTLTEHTKFIQMGRFVLDRRVEEIRRSFPDTILVRRLCSVDII
jgi:hypothetical protein